MASNFLAVALTQGGMARLCTTVHYPTAYRWLG